MAFTTCAIKFLTGWDCPGCGLGHSLLELLRGNFGESVVWHPMGVMLAAAAMSWPWWRRASISPQMQRWVSHGVLAGFFAPWIFKLF